MYPYNHKMGQCIRTDVAGVACDRAFLSHFHVDAEDAPAANTNGVMAATALGAEAKSITAGLTNPAVPRNLQVDGNVPGATNSACRISFMLMNW